MTKTSIYTLSFLKRTYFQIETKKHLYQSMSVWSDKTLINFRM